MLQLTRFGWMGATMVLAAILTPYYSSALVNTVLLFYVGVLLAVPLGLLFRRGGSAKSRFEGSRLRYLAVTGGLGGVFTLLEYLPYFGLDIPPVGTLLVLVFLYLLSQSLASLTMEFSVATPISISSIASFSCSACVGGELAALVEAELIGD